MTRDSRTYYVYYETKVTLIICPKFHYFGQALLPAAFLVFFPAAAGAGSIARDFFVGSGEGFLLLDFSDITKPYAEKMEYLASVRDGDKGTIGLGYNQIVLTATQRGDDNPNLTLQNIVKRPSN
jgi:hypothetical protein